MASLGRRLVLGCAILGLATGFVTSCSSESNDSPDTTTAANSAADGVTEYPLTLTTPYGETTLDAAPERIVTLGWGDETDALLALGIVPVASPLSSGGYDWVKPISDDLFEVDAYNLDFEELQELSPDLIVNLTDDISADYDRLSQIAPVLTYSSDQGTIRDWRESLELIGTTVDRENKADELIAEVDSKIAAAKDANPEFEGKTLTYAMDYGGDTGIWYQTFDGSAPQKLFQSLGFAAPADADDFSEGAQEVSNERLDVLDSDVILISAVREGNLDAFEKSAVFRELPGVKGGGYFPLVEPAENPQISWSIRSPSALNVPWVLDKLTPILQDATAGNGKKIDG
ncbi:iron-siderophore ABC transporter substrate-binding protein [Rhodococcoides yunnanense]|uniref:iron-siderophore ABC transporter substrate-binding protein n=1 Tax=Rhodococcoides yunnanense TaxID=278209 RepID=UPI0009348A3B|nr:iron-siderophore ABC transporter substrate-binding protein [Rhodococcus yunnanensis]